MALKKLLRANYAQIFFVCAAFTLMVVIGSISVSNIIRKESLSTVTVALNETEKTIRSYLREPKIAFDNIYTAVSDILDRGESQEAVEQYLTQTTNLLRSQEEGVMGFNAVYGYIRDEFVSGFEVDFGDDYIPQQRPWYQLAVRNEGAEYTAPYIDADTGHMIMSLAQEIYGNNGDYYGVLSLDIDISWLMGYAESLQFSEGGYGMIINQYYYTIAHPNEEYRNLQLQELGKGYTEISEMLRTGRSVSALRIQDIDNNEVIVFFKQLYNGWYVGVVMPVGSYYSDLYLNICILAVLGIILTLALCYILLRLSAAKMQSEDESKSKSTFLAQMSHEIRTPMNAIMGMSELILRNELPQNIYENAQGIRNASVNLLSIINDILDFSKIESGALEIVESDYQFTSLINDAVNIIRMRLIDRPIHFAVFVDCSIPASLRGDEVRVRQILLNLLSNAVKYTERGSVSLSVSGTVEDGVVNLEIAVSDTGVGIKKEDMNKLFGDFSRLDTTRNRNVEGTGLGLAITRNLVRMMGGEINVQSDYGIGSEFIVMLPQRFLDDKPCASVDNPEEKSVLLYETREAYRDSIAGTLEVFGVRCVNADSVAAMLEHACEYPYLFISSFMYESVMPVLSELKNPPQLILIADVNETAAPKDAEVLIMPAHAISIANIFNGVQEEIGGVVATGVGFTAPEARILIVDDISANLKVAEGLMAPYEMAIDLCWNGNNAIQMIQENVYDLVFMDHMMPEMDGLEATSIIRALEGARYKELPIIALTANAVSGIREMFVQNGMNDLLAKPIEMSKLNAILEKWIPKEKHRAVRKTDFIESEEFIGQTRKLKWLSADKASKALGGYTAYEKAFRLSVKLLPENIDKLEAYINTDLSLYAIEVHGVKGVLNGIGAYLLGDEAFKLEELSKAGDAEACKKLHPAFINEAQAFLNAIKPILGESEKQQGSPHQLLEVISEIEQAIRNYDGLLALELITPVALFTYGEFADAILKELVSALEHFDFDKALDDLSRLKDEIT